MKDKLGVILPSSFDDKDWNELLLSRKFRGSQNIPVGRQKLRYACKPHLWEP